MCSFLDVWCAGGLPGSLVSQVGTVDTYLSRARLQENGLVARAASSHASYSLAGSGYLIAYPVSRYDHLRPSLPPMEGQLPLLSPLIVH